MRADAEIFLHVGFGRRTAVQDGIESDNAGQIEQGNRALAQAGRRHSQNSRRRPIQQAWWSMGSSSPGRESLSELAVEDRLGKECIAEAGADRWSPATAANIIPAWRLMVYGLPDFLLPRFCQPGSDEIVHHRGFLRGRPICRLRVQQPLRSRGRGGRLFFLCGGKLNS